MNNYLYTLAGQFASREDLEHLTFVFPNRRAGLFFRKYIGQHLTKPQWSPAIRTIDECFHELTDLKIADTLTLLVRLYHIYSDLTPGKTESFGSWLKWGQMMAADFSEIDNHLVRNVKELFSTISDLHEIDYTFSYLSEQQKNAIRRFWGEVNEGMEKGRKDVHLRFIDTWHKLYPCYEGLRQSLLQDGLAYEGMLHREVIEHFDEIEKERLHEQYVFIGFNALTRSEETLMLRLKEAGRAQFYFDYDHPVLRDPDNRASLFVEHNKRLFDLNIEPFDNKTIDFPEITLTSIPSDTGEAMQVSRLLGELADTSAAKDWTRTAVVLPDETLLLPMLNTLPETVDKVNVTMGYPLKATPEYMPLTIERDEQPLQETVNALREEWNNMLNDFNSETIYSFQSTLNRVEDVLIKDKRLQLTTRDFMYVMRMLTDSMSVSYVGEPLNGLQIMGVLETRALDFDNLIITGFNDELYPGKSHGNSYIPYTLRKGFGLPVPERQDAIFAYNFYRMLSHAKKVWLITNSQADEQHSGEVSRYMQQLVYQYNVPIKEETIVLNINTGESLKPTVAPPQPDKEQTLYFSPTTLNDYLSCEQKYYYKYVLHLKEPDTTDETETDDRTMGIAFHSLAEHLYGEGDDVFDKQRIEHIQSNLNNDWDSRPEIDPLRQDPIAQAVIQHFINRLLELDAAQGGFRRIGLEKKVRQYLHIDGKDIVLDGTIDRIDEKDGGIRLIDYKTGNTEFLFDNLQDAFETDKYKHVLQTMTYCYLYRRDQQLNDSSKPVAPYIFAIRAIDSAATYNGKVHPKKDKNADFVYTDQTDKETEQLLHRLISTIIETRLQGTYKQTSNSHNCSSCAFTRLCGR